MLCRADRLPYKYCYLCGEKLDGNICRNKKCDLHLKDVNKMIKIDNFYLSIKRKRYDW